MRRCRSTTGSAAPPASAARTQVATAAPQEVARPHDHGALRRQCRRRPAVALRAGADFDRGAARRGRHRQLRGDQPGGARDGRAGGLQRRAGHDRQPTSRRSTASASPSSGSGRARSARCRWCSTSIRRSPRTPNWHDLNTITLSYSFYRAARAGPAGRGSRDEGGDELDLERSPGDGDETMADAHAKHHDYHLVDPSPWPIVGSVAALRARGRR